MAHCGKIWTYVGRPREALDLIRKAMRRDSYFEPNYFFILGNAHRLMGNYDDAIAAFKAWRDADPNFLGPDKSDRYLCRGGPNGGSSRHCQGEPKARSQILAKNTEEEPQAQGSGRQTAYHRKFAEGGRAGMTSRG